MTIPAARGAEPVKTEESVAAWLRDHPDFFLRHGDLLATLRLPHARGTAISLVERQVEVLREKQQTTESRLSELVSIARANEQLAVRIHHFTRRLMAAPTRREILAQIERSFREELDASQIVLLLFSANASDAGLRFVRAVDPREDALTGFDSLFASGKPRCGQIRDTQREYLFGADAGEIGSVALVPLSGQGLLVLGSHDRDRFHPGMSTDFLATLGELIADALSRD